MKLFLEITFYVALFASLFGLASYLGQTKEIPPDKVSLIISSLDWTLLSSDKAQSGCTVDEIYASKFLAIDKEGYYVSGVLCGDLLGSFVIR